MQYARIQSQNTDAGNVGDVLGDNGRRSQCIGSDGVFVKGQASTRCTYSRKAGRNEVMAKSREKDAGDLSLIKGLECR